MMGMRRVMAVFCVMALAVCGSLFVDVPAGAAPGPDVPFMSHCPAGLHKSASDSHFDVWTCGASAAAVAEAKKALDLAEKHYAAETALMGGPPIPDSGSPAEGGDKKIDVYVAEPGAGQEVTRWDPAIRDYRKSDLTVKDAAVTIDTDEKGTAASGWIVLNAARLGSPAFESDFVHEFFHLLQNRTNVGYCSRGKWWFTEASATWAEAYFVPATAEDEVYARYVKGFEKAPSLSLTSMVKDPSGSYHGYSSFIWPYFMQQEAGASSVAQVWKQLKGVTTCAGMNAVLNEVLSFAAYFKDFAVRNLDSPLPNLTGGGSAWPDKFGPRYQDLDPRFPQVLPVLAAPDKGDKPLSVPESPGSGKYPYQVSVHVSLPPLSAQYNAFDLLPGFVADVGLDFSALHGPADVTLVGADHGTHANYIRIPVTGQTAQVCLTIDQNAPAYPPAAAGGDTPGDMLYVIVDNHGLTGPVEGSYQLTARADCAREVSGTLSDTTTLHLTGPPDEVETYTNTVTVKLTDTRYGFSQTGTSESSTFKGVTAGNGCTVTSTAKGSGPLPTAVSFYAFNAPASAHGPYFADTGELPLKGTYSGCGTSGTTTGSSDGFQYCMKASQSHYADGSESVLAFKCSDTAKFTGGSETWTGGGTLHATDADSCGLWTTGCSISPSAATRRR
jgi:hypothetical protein